MTSKHLAKFFANKYHVNDQQEKSTRTRNHLGPESGLIFQPEFNDAIYEIYPSSFNWFGSKRPNVYLSKKRQLVEFNDVFLFNFIVKSLRKYEFANHTNQSSEDLQFIEGVKLLIDSNPVKPSQKIIKLIELIFYQCNSQVALLKSTLPRITDAELKWQIFTAKSSLIVTSCLTIINIIAKWRMGTINSEDEIKIQEFRFLAENTIREINAISNSETVSQSFKLVQNKKQPAIIQKIVRFLKIIMIERAHQYSSFNQALFFISIFGSRIFPALFKKLSEKFIEKPATNTNSTGKKKPLKKTPITMKDAQFIGFVVGTMFGAGGCASVVTTCLDYLRDKSLGRRLEDTPLSSIFVSKSIWMTFGALIGIAINIAARQSIHMAVGKIIQSYLNNPQFIRKIAGKQNELMAKIMARTFSNMLSKETSKMLLPSFDKKPITTQKKDSDKSSGFATMTNDPFIKSLLKDQLSFVNKKNKIAGYLVDNILLGESNILEKPQQVFRKFSNLKSKYYNALNRIIPAENSVWHYWSTMTALFLSNRFSKQVADQSFEQQESQLYELNAELREILSAFSQRFSNMERTSKL